MWRILVALLAASAPLAHQALEWSARGGLDYVREETWIGDRPRSTYPRLTLNVALDTLGYVQGPEVAAWSLGANYVLTDYQGSVGTRRQLLLFRGRLALLNDRSSPLHLEVHASRAYDDTAVESGNGDFNSTITVLGATASLRVPERPALTLGYTRTTQERRGQIVPDSDQTIHTIDGGIIEGTSAFTYGARYHGNLSKGTYTAQNFDDHRVDLVGSAHFVGGWKATLQDSYYVRQPTVDGVANPRQEFNAFSATATSALVDREMQSISYRYNHGLQEAPLTASIERAAHRLSYRSFQNLSAPEWRLAANAELSYTDDRAGADRATAAGELVGSTVYWRRGEASRNWELQGGPVFGLVQPDAGPSLFGFGLHAGGSFTRGIAPGALQAGYSADFTHDLRAVGQSLTQSVFGSVTRPFREGTLTGLLVAGASRHDDDLLGTRLSRSIALSGQYRTPAYSTILQAQLADNANPSLDESVVGDGLIVAPYDSHALGVTLSGSVGVLDNVSLTGLLRFSNKVMPDRPSVQEVEGRAGVLFAYGALRLHVEDRYAIADVAGDSRRVNLFLVQFYRAFGSRD